MKIPFGLVCTAVFSSASVVAEGDGWEGFSEKLEHESGDSNDLYHVWFNAEDECELLPRDKTRVVSTQPVKEQKTNE